LRRLGALDCSKKVNHEMPLERFSPSRAPRERAHLSLRHVARNKWPPIRGKKSQRQNQCESTSYLAEDAVVIELVSAANSLRTGKFTGKFVKRGVGWSFRRENVRAVQWVGIKFPAHRNREFFESIRQSL
jgi:hypothetical protein